MDKKEALKIVQESGSDLVNLSDKFKKDKDVVLEAIKQDAWSLIYANEKSSLDIQKEIDSRANQIQLLKKEIESLEENIISKTKREINITEIQDEYIEIKLGQYRHLLSTSKHKKVRISSHWNNINWNVYDGDKLINLKREFDVLNYFSKYGFEYYKRKYTGKGKKYIILKNNNN